MLPHDPTGKSGPKKPLPDHVSFDIAISQCRRVCVHARTINCMHCVFAMQITHMLVPSTSFTTFLICFMIV